MRKGEHFVTAISEFQLALRKAYRKDPCLILPNAIWKTEERLPALQCSLEVTVGAELLDLIAWDQEGLHVFWNKHRKIDDSVRQIMEQSRFLIVHDDHFRQMDVHPYRLVKPFFRRKHDHKNIEPYALRSEFYIKESDPIKECDEISDLIGRCYRDLHPSPDTVGTWSSHPVFDKSLWIWIMDKHKDSPVALGIAEVDRSLPEGSLEWIQVLPEYQGRGLGKALVLELLHRLRDKAEFTTVSGEADNCRRPGTLQQTNPERLYRSCGFAGDDVWWLLRR